ncbi:MAG: flagellar export chaperone FlgN [Phycisphaerae bacterium]|jgi:hypothetical protein
MTRNGLPTIALHAQPDETPSAALAACAAELNENLAALQGLLRQLLGQAEEKLAAIKTADTQRMQSCSVRESDLLAEVSRVRQRRTAIFARIAQGLPTDLAPPRTLGEVCRQLPEPLSSVFRARSVGLQCAAAQLQEKNALVARVAQNLQTHIRAVFATLAKDQQETVVYGPQGQHESRNVRSWVDAVG